MHACIVILSFWVLSIAFNPRAVGGDPSLDGTISFQPNVIPELKVKFVEDYFHFTWLKNKFDLKLLVGMEDKEHSLRDFWERNPDVKWKEVLNWSDFDLHFGFLVWDIPEALANQVEYLVWKIEAEDFEWEFDEGINLFTLPDNLQLSFDDHLNKGYELTFSEDRIYVRGIQGLPEWDLDPITYSAPTITVTDNLSSEANWYVWNASNVNGWGAVFNYDNMTYFYNSSKLKITSGGSFVDKNVQMVFNTTSEVAIFNDGSTFQLGTLEDSVNKVTSGGVSVLFDLAGGANDVAFYADSGSTTKLYGSVLESQSHQSIIYIYHASATAYFYETLFSGLTVKALNAETNFKRVTQTAGTFGSGTGFIRVTNGVFEDVSIEGNQYAMTQCYGTFRDLKARNYTYLNYLYHVDWDNQYLINADVDLWAFRFLAAYTKEVYRQYNFDLTVTYPNGTAIQNANVTITHYGQGETQDFTELTDSNGQISTKTLSMGFYNFTGGNTIYSYNLYNIEITNATGYQIYNANFTLSEQTEWIISLTPEPYNWFAPTIIMGLFACFMVIYALTSKN